MSDTEREKLRQAWLDDSAEAQHRHSLATRLLLNRILAAGRKIDCQKCEAALAEADKFINELTNSTAAGIPRCF